MSTAMKSKAPAAAESWSSWLEDLDRLQEERAEITGLAEARDALTRAKNGARYAIGLASNSYHYPGNFEHSNAEDDPEVLLNLMERIGANMSRALQASNWHQQSAERQAYTKDLASRAKQSAVDLQKAATEVAELERARSEVDQRLEDLEAKAPKASTSSLAALRKERDAAAAERDRIAKALGSMTADDSPLALAREDEKAAQERLDEAEALLAMGEANDEDVKAAKSEADKARKALEQKQADHRSQEAARRGMSRKLEQADSRLETLNRAYHQALGRVRHADLAALEGEMVAEIERIAQQRLQALAEIYADLEEAEPESSYGRAAIEVKLPYLHHHPDRDELRHGLTITAYGREE